MNYQVLINDNFHYQDEEYRSTGPRFPTLDEAVVCCKRIVDRSLLSHYRLGMPAHKLITLYCMFGDDPFVSTGAPGPVPFSARAYAETRIRDVYGPFLWNASNPDYPRLSRLMAVLLAPVVYWRIRRRLRRPVT